MNNLELEKIKYTVAYLSSKIPQLHLTKLLKLFYYFDFISVLETGRPVTNDTYYHLPYGPVPTFIKDQLVLLRDEISKQEATIMDDGTKHEPIKSIFSDIVELELKKSKIVIKNLKEAEKEYFSEYETELLDDIIDEFKGYTATQLVRKTHNEVPYSQTSMMNIIDYKLAFHLIRANVLPKRNYPFNIEVSQAEFFNK